MVIVVTGGIGSGKSQACRIISERYGFPVYEADVRVKHLYDEFPELTASLEKSLGCRLRNEAGYFIPSVLSERIFADPKALETVEAHVFPYLQKDFESYALENPGHIVFESATILEKPWFEGFGDAVLLIDAPVSLRLDRASRRDNADEMKVRARVNAQPLMNAFSDGTISDYPEDSLFGKARQRVSCIINNDADLAEFEESVISAVADMLNGKEINVEHK